MSSPKPLGGPFNNVQRLAEREFPLFRQEVIHALAVHELHGEEVVSPFLADVMDLNDVGVIQGRRRLGFPLKPFQVGGVLSVLLG